MADGGGDGDDSWQCNIHSRIPGILRALLADSASVRQTWCGFAHSTFTLDGYSGREMIFPDK